MLEREDRWTPGGVRAVLMDSVSFLSDDDSGVAVVCGSHGGTSSGEYAARRSPGLLICNDAGVGKDGAGIAGLIVLAEAGIAAVAVSADSAHIGDADDTWREGIVAHVNAVASAVRAGMTVTQAIDAWSSGSAPRPLCYEGGRSGRVVDAHPSHRDRDDRELRIERT